MLKVGLALLVLFILGCAAARDVPGETEGDDDDALFYVNGYPVSSAEFDTLIAQVRRSIVLNRDILAAGPPTTPSTKDAPTPESAKYHDASTDFMRREAMYLLAKYANPLLEVMDSYGAEVVTLSYLIGEYGVFTAALSAGYSATDEQVRVRVERDRLDYESVFKVARGEYYGDESWVMTAWAIEEVGMDTYWNEVRPAQVRRDISSTTYRNITLAGLHGDELPAAIQEIIRASYEDSIVEFTGRWTSDATVEQVLQFRRDYKAAEDARPDFNRFVLRGTH